MGRERGELLKPQHSCCCNLPIIKRHRRQTRDRTNPTRRPPTAMATRQPAVADFAFPDYVTVRPSLHQRLPATAPALAFRRLDLTIVKRKIVLSGDCPMDRYPPNVPLACQALLCIVWQGEKALLSKKLRPRPVKYYLSSWISEMRRQDGIY